MMRRSAAATLVVVTVAGCSSLADTAASKAAINDFHRRLNAGQFEPIYDAASADMKGATTAPAFDALLGAVHRKLGLFRTGTVVGWNANYTTNGSFVTITFASTYDRGKANERFVYRIADKAPALAGYNINSDALILN